MSLRIFVARHRLQNTEIPEHLGILFPLKYTQYTIISDFKLRRGCTVSRKVQSKIV